MTSPQGPNQRWSLDFVANLLADGGRFRALTIVDDGTRENPALVADTLLSGCGVARELERLIAERGRTQMRLGDNGRAFAGNAVLASADQGRVECHAIASGKPAQNAFIGSLVAIPRRLKPGPDRTGTRTGSGYERSIGGNITCNARSGRSKAGVRSMNARSTARFVTDQLAEHVVCHENRVAKPPWLD